MGNLKNLSKALTLDKFNKLFTKENQGYTHNNTGTVVFCPCDLGFKFDQDDCLAAENCEECWELVKEYLRFREG